MKKLASILMLLALLAGCHPQEKPPPSPAEVQAQEKAIEQQALQELEADARKVLDSAEMEVMQRAIDRVAKDSTDIHRQLQEFEQELDTTIDLE